MMDPPPLYAVNRFCIGYVYMWMLWRPAHHEGGGPVKEVLGPGTLLDCGVVA